MQSYLLSKFSNGFVFFTELGRLGSEEEEEEDLTGKEE